MRPARIGEEHFQQFVKTEDFERLEALNKKLESLLLSTVTALHLGVSGERVVAAIREATNV